MHRPGSVTHKDALGNLMEGVQPGLVPGELGCSPGTWLPLAEATATPTQTSRSWGDSGSTAWESFSRGRRPTCGKMGKKKGKERKVSRGTWAWAGGWPGREPQFSGSLLATTKGLRISPPRVAMWSKQMTQVTCAARRRMPGGGIGA